MAVGVIWSACSACAGDYEDPEACTHLQEELEINCGHRGDEEDDEEFPEPEKTF